MLYFTIFQRGVSVNFGRGFVYGAGVLWVLALYLAQMESYQKKDLLKYWDYKYRISSNLLVRSCDMRLDNQQ